MPKKPDMNRWTGYKGRDLESPTKTILKSWIRPKKKTEPRR